MAGGYENLPGDPLEQLRRIVEEVQRRLAELERPTGSQIYDTLATLTDLVNNLAEEIENVSASGATWQGPVSAGSGAIATTSGNITTTSGYVFTPAGYAFDITYTRRAAWLGNDGRVGWASSSRDHKTKIRNAKLDPLAILSIAPRLFNYKAEVEKHAEDAGYKVATEFGAIAEELHELGLWQVVVYEDGQPVGIHYDLLGLLAIEAAKHVWMQQGALADRVAILEAAQGL